MPKLSNFVTEKRALRLRILISRAKGLELLSAIITSVGFLVSPRLFQSDAQSLWGWIAFAIFLTLTASFLVLSNVDDPTESGLFANFFILTGAFFAGLISTAFMLWGVGVPVELFSLGLWVLIPALVLDGLPLAEIRARRTRAVPVGTYGNLGGMVVESKLTRRRSALGLAIVTSMPIIVIGALFSVRAGSSPSSLGVNANLLILSGLLSLSLGTILGVLQYMRRKNEWDTLVLDTFEQGRLWLCDEGDAIGYFKLSSPTVSISDRTTVKLTGVIHKRGHVEIKTRTESDANRLASIIRGS